MTVRVSMDSGNIGAVQKDTLTTQVLGKLMDWIMDGKLKMGEKLNSEELSRQLGVSRMPIREALNGLEKMGLAESKPYIGVKLVTLTHDDIIQIYLMRQALESLVAKKACENMQEKDIKELESIHKTYIQIVKKPKINAKDLYLQNRKFHFAIYKLSGMDRICSAIEGLWDTLSFFKLIYGREVLKDNNGIDKMIEEHQSYIDDLKKGDAEALSKNLYGNLNKRINGIYSESDYYTL